MLASIRTTVIAVFSALTLAPLPLLANSEEDLAHMSAMWQAYVESVETGDAEAILASAEAAAEAGRKVFNEDDAELPLLLYNYGKALLNDGQNEPASAVLKESLELSEKLHGKSAPELVDILVALGDSMAKPFSGTAQLKYYRRSLKITEQQYGRESQEFADASVRAAMRAYDLSHRTDGLKNLREAREVYMALDGDQSSRIGMTDYLLSKFEFSKGRYKAAAEHGLAALPNLEGDSEQLRNLQLFTRAILVKSYEERNMSDEATPHCVAIGRISKTNHDQDYLPLFRLAPRYPENQLRLRKEGSVDLEFTIDEYGFVRDPQVIASSSKGFEVAAIDAVERFRYAPRFVDGAATPVEGVKTRISFQLEP